MWKVGSKAFYKYAIPENPKYFWGKNLAKNKPKESKGKPSWWNRKLKLKKIS